MGEPGHRSRETEHETSPRILRILDGNSKSFLELAGKRRSCRSYSDTPVPDEQIGNCLEAARLAPSACNRQPWRFIIVRNSELRRKICDDGLLPGIPMPWLRKAPVIVVLCAETSLITHTLAPMISKVQYHLIDIGIAGEHFVLEAEAQGLGTCWIGWFKEKQVRKILDLPRSYQILSLISLGYPANPAEPQMQDNRLKTEEISRIVK